VRLKSWVIIAIAAVFASVLTGCSVPDYDPVTIVYENYDDSTTVTWAVEGTEVTRTQQTDDDDPTETSYELPDRAAFVTSVHEELHPPKWDGCEDANEMTIEAQDPDGTLHVSKLADCGVQLKYVDDMFWALGDGR